MNREKLEEWLKDISTPTGLSYSGDQTLSNSEVDTILEYVDNLQSKIDKAIEYINTIKDNTPNSTRKDFAKMILINYELLLDILKEDK